MTAPALRLVTFNVKDLFSPLPDAPGESEVFERKVDRLAADLAAADADVVALQEVGDDAAFARVLGPLGFAHAVVAPGDRRGIRCALLTREPPVEAAVHATDELPFPGFVEGDPPPFPGRLRLRRPVPRVRVRTRDGVEVDVLTVHLKSKLPILLRDAQGRELPATNARARAEGSLRSLVARAAEASFVRGVLDELETAAGDAPREAVVLGDFNDVAGSVPVQVVAGTGPRRLVDCVASLVGAARTTTLHGGRPEAIDHVLATPALAGRVARAAVRNEALRDHGPLVEGAPRLTEDSDHALVVVDFA